MVAVVLAALVIGVSNVGLTNYDLVAGVSGEAKLAAFIQGPVAPPGWEHRVRDDLRMGEAALR